MTTSAVTAEIPVAVDVKVTADALVVELRDGRVVSVPLGWYPRLAAGTPAERRRWELVGPGIGIHWPALDEDISVDALLHGLRSNESVRSLQRWRASRGPANRALQPTSRARRTGKAKLTEWLVEILVALGIKRAHLLGISDDRPDERPVG